MGETLKFRPSNWTEILLLCPFGSSMKVCATQCGPFATCSLFPVGGLGIHGEARDGQSYS